QATPIWHRTRAAGHHAEGNLGAVYGAVSDDLLFPCQLRSRTENLRNCKDQHSRQSQEDWTPGSRLTLQSDSRNQNQRSRDRLHLADREIAVFKRLSSSAARRIFLCSDASPRRVSREPVSHRG